MALPSASNITLPLDTGNTGKPVRTQIRSIDGVSVHEHFFVPISARDIKGVYYYTTSDVYVATAHVFGTSGFFWFINPAGATVNIAIARMVIQSNLVTSLSTPTMPLLTLCRFTFTGTASGTTQAAAYRDSTDAAPQGSFRTAITGMTLAAETDIAKIAPPVAVGTAGWATCPPSNLEVVSPYVNDDEIILRPGEGIGLFQSVNGTTSDTRQFTCNMRVMEFSNA